MLPFKTLVIQQSNNYQIYQGHDLTVHNSLPPATYSVKHNKMKESYFLEQIEDFVLPSKIYKMGCNIQPERILNSFKERPNNTGVLLRGVKGSGKTLLAKRIAVSGQNMGYPVIIISDEYSGTEFNAFIQSINCPAIIIFDEFEKTYDWRNQNQLLTLLDGVFLTRKLFIFTTNNDNDISHFMSNRPGRIYYSIKFDVISPEFVEEYCNDKLKKKDNMQDIIKYIRIFPYFNFDMLASVVEEMNRFDETFNEVVPYLNIEPEINKYDTYNVILEVLTNDINYSLILEKNIDGFNPKSYDYELDIEDFDDISKNPDVEDFLVKASKYQLRDTYRYRNTLNFNHTNLRSFDPHKGIFTYTYEVFQGKINLLIKRNSFIDSFNYNSIM